MVSVAWRVMSGPRLHEKHICICTWVMKGPGCIRAVLHEDYA